MKYKRPDLNTLTRILALGLRVHERRMGRAARAAIRLRIKTLDQRDEIGGLPIAIVPFSGGTLLHRVCFAHTVGIDKLYRDEVSIRHGESIRNREGVLLDGLDRSPDVDNLEPALQQLRCLLWKMVLDAIFGRGGGLIDVDSLNGCPDAVRVTGRGRRTTNGMVEDEDTGGTGSVSLLGNLAQWG